jgi:hypothetical protein
MEIELVQKYKDFLGGISENEDVKAAISGECMGFISSIQQLPMRHSGVSAPIYFESLVNKLVSHLQSQLIILPAEKRLDYRCTQSTVWILRAFRTMIGKFNICRISFRITVLLYMNFNFQRMRGEWISIREMMMAAKSKMKPLPILCTHTTPLE